MDQRTIKAQYSIASLDNVGVNYWAIPKCGSTTLLYELIKVDSPNVFEKYNKMYMDNEVHQWVHNTRILRYLTAEEALNNGYDNITTVRGPERRFISGYKDFMYKRPNHGIGGTDDYREEFQQIRANPSVPAMLDLLVKYNDQQRDIHFRSQTSFLHSPHIVKLNIDNIHNEVRDKTKLLIDVGQALHVTESDLQLTQYEKDMLFEIYKEDYQMIIKERLKFNRDGTLQ